MLKDKTLLTEYEFATLGVDQNGRLLRTPSDTEYIYRAVTDRSYSIFLDLIKQDTLKRLNSLGLVETHETPFAIEGYAAILKHRRVPFPSFPHEWTMEMLRDAGKTICSLAIELDSLGYCLQDAHAGNIMFDSTRPVFVDWGSIVEKNASTNRRWLEEYRKDVYLPLWLCSKGFTGLAYDSLFEYGAESIIKKLFSRKYLRSLPLKCFMLRKQYSEGNFPRILTALLESTSRLDLRQPRGKWTDYCQDSYTHKNSCIEDFAATLSHKATILDIGCNKGEHAIKLAQEGHKVVAFDADKKAIESLFHVAKERHYEVLPLQIDITRPGAPYGPDLSGPSVFDRLRCDYVLALAITHHLARRYEMSFTLVASILTKFARKGILVEYVDSGDYFLRDWKQKGWKQPDWYTEQNFRESFNKYFVLGNVWASFKDEEIVRKIFFYRKRA